MKLRIVSLSIFILITVFSVAQDLRFKKISTQDGENIVGVQCLLKDSQGYVWMGSFAFDLIRFDGQNTRRYTQSDLQTPHFKSSRVLLIFEDSKNDLWIGTNVGALMKYNRSLDQFELMNDSASSVPFPFFSFVEDKDGGFWFGSLGGGLLHYNPATKKFTNYKNIPNDLSSLPDNYINGLVFDSKGALWIGTTAGLCRYDATTNSFVRYTLSNANSDDTYRYRVIRSITRSSTNKLVISTYGGLHVFDISSGRDEHFVHRDEDVNSISHNSLFQAVENPDGSFWIATYGGGLNFFDPATKKFKAWKKDESNTESISSNNLFSVYRDAAGLVWIGADDNSVCVFDTQAKKFHSIKHQSNKPEGISAGWVHTVYQQSDSVLWLGLNGNGLNRLNLTTGKATKHTHDARNPGSIGHNAVVAIDRDSKNRIWVGLTGGGINMLNADGRTFTRYEMKQSNSINNNAVSAMLVDDDDFIWATSFRSGLNIYDIRKNVFKNINDDSLKNATGISFAFTDDIFELNGNIWFNTRTQVVVYDKALKQFIKIAPASPLAITTASSMLEIKPYSDTEMVLLSGNEIKRIHYKNPNEIEESVIASIRGEEVFKSIVMDSRNHIWGVTKDKLVKWNAAQNEKRIYTKSDGLIASDFESVHINTYGRIFLTTLDGLNWFVPAEIEDDTVQRKIVFTDFKLYNRSVEINKPDTVFNFSLPRHISQLNQLTLEPSHGFFSIEFAALEFMAPNKIRYAYKLEGFDDEWIQVGNRNFASYTNLDPGDYLFQVKASNPDGFWSQQIATLVLTINPPYWKTWWFRTFILLFVGGVAYAIHRYRLLQSLKIERLRNKIASDLHDEVGSSLTRISIYSDLMQNESSDKEKSHYLNRISTMSREIVSTMSDIVWSIDNRSDTLQALLLRMKDFATELLPYKNIHLDFSLKGIDEKATLDPVVRQNVYLIFKEALNNIAKHAEATHVLVEIINSNTQFVMRIKDNGKSFNPSRTQQGNGLRNMARRAKAIGGELTYLHDKGTEITFTRKPI